MPSKGPVPAPATQRFWQKAASGCLMISQVRWLRLLFPPLLLATLAVVSLMPGEYRPHLLGSDAYEHLLAYALTAFAIATLARKATGSLWLLLGLVAYAGILELCQIPLPHRTASLEDFVASSAGVALGLLLAIVIRRRIPLTFRP